MKGLDYILFDGAAGTYYEAITRDGQSCELANIDNPDLILKIHQEYIEAGANAIKTNTFGANTHSLNCDFKRVSDIIKSGFGIAAEAAKGNAMVFCDIGPINFEDEDFLLDEYKRIVDVFLSVGGSYFLLETFSDDKMPLLISQYIKAKNKEAFVIVSFAVDADGWSVSGRHYRELSEAAKSCKDIDAYGLNCICGPAHLCDLIKENPPSGKPMSVMPNAGYPSRGAIRFNQNYDYFGSKVLELYRMGVYILGGCCGTTPLHIKSAANALKKGRGKQAPLKAQRATAFDKGYKNQFKEALEQGKKVVIAELDPPFDCDIDYLIKGAEMLRDAGADLVSVADSPLARARADSVMISAKIKREAKVDTLCHITCRDRNLVGLKGAVLGGYIEGVRNYLALTGDPVAAAGAKGVFDLNSYTMLGFFDGLNKELFGADNIFSGAAININAANLENELNRAVKKQQRGAGFFVTQPVFGKQGIDRLKSAKMRLKKPVIAGIMPIVSYRNAMFMINEVPGISIDEKIVEMFRDTSPNEAVLLGIKIAQEIIDGVYDYTDGFFVIPPLKRVLAASKIIRYIRGKEGKA